MSNQDGNRQDGNRIEELEGEIARLRALVAEYAAEAARLRQFDQSRAQIKGATRATLLSFEEASFARDMGVAAMRPTRRRSA